MIRSVIAAIKNSYKPLCKQESDNLWCRGKLLISIKRATWPNLPIKVSKQINNRISFKYDIHLCHSHLSTFFFGAGVPNGEFPEFFFYYTCIYQFNKKNISKSDAILTFFPNIHNSLIFANKITNLILYIILICNTGKTRVIKLPINILLINLNQ
jgi:hypothetical protein